jgi:hypothetical protein
MLKTGRSLSANSVPVPGVILIDIPEATTSTAREAISDENSESESEELSDDDDEIIDNPFHGKAAKSRNKDTARQREYSRAQLCLFS